MSHLLVLSDSQEVGWVVLEWSHNPPMLQRFKNLVPWADRRWERHVRQWRMKASWLSHVLTMVLLHGYQVEDRRIDAPPRRIPVGGGHVGH